MTNSHYVVQDKNRRRRLVFDGEFHPLSIKDADSVIKDSIKPVAAGRYNLQYQISTLTELAPTFTRIELRVQRYPIDPTDGGTAWTSMELKGTKAKTAYDTKQADIDIEATGTYSRSIGIDYRGVKTAAGKPEPEVYVDDLILKFTRQWDIT